MKSFALAMTAAVATASNYRSYDPSSRYSSSRTPSYGHQHNGYNNYNQPQTQYGYQTPSRYPSQHQHQQTSDPYHQHADGSSHQVNPWEQQQSSQYGHSVPDGWLNPYQQYSKPTIAYKPNVDKPTFAVCEIQTGGSGIASSTSTDITGTIEIVQIPHKPATVKWNLDGDGTNAVDLVVYPRINTTGRIFVADQNDMNAGLACGGIGTKEFNPLQETDRYGRVNPYQDFTRGRLDKVTFDDSGLVTDQIQNYLLQNLTGKDSIIGRSISIYTVPLADVVPLDATNDTPSEIEACCVIALDETPYRWLPTPHYHQQNYGHRGY